MNTEKHNHRLLSVRKVAEIDGVCARTVLRRIHSGALPAIQIGHQYRIEAKHLKPILRPSHSQKRSGRAGPLLDQLLTPDDVAEEFQLSTRSVRRLAQGGHLKAYRIRNRWRFSRAQISAFRRRASRNLVLR
jgi:excisionase family DNA binding protein